MSDHLSHPSRRRFVVMIGASMLWPVSGRANDTGSMSGTAFGTTWRIAGQRGSALENLRPDIDALFASIDREMSPWRPDSALSRFNAAPAGWHPAGDDLVHVTTGAIALAGQSGGAFDPTVGPLVARWGFGPIEGGKAPDWRGLSVGTGRICKAQDDMTLDLCGIAKGWALDCAIDLIRAAGFDNMLADLGGELRALGRHPSGRSWQVAVEDPTSGDNPPALLRLPAGSAVATSGLRSQSYTLAGRTYGHIIDPVTRAPADTGLLSVTVVAADAMVADGWATALFAAGRDAGELLARRHGIAALFLVRDGSSLRQFTTPAIEGLLL